MSSDIASFLAGSDTRVALLTYLTEQPAAPAMIADELSLARRSVQRHLANFVERGWAVKTDGEYRLTTAGTLIADEHTRYLDTLALIEEFDEFYTHFPNAVHAPDPEWLQNAELTVSTQANPQAPMHHYLDSLREFETERIRMLSPVLSRLFHDAHAELAFEGIHTELVMADEVIARARELNPAEFNVVVSVDILDLYRHPAPIRFGLTIGDTRLLLSVYDDGQLKACIESTNAVLLAWADDLFEKFRDRSERIEPTISLPFTLRKS